MFIYFLSSSGELNKLFLFLLFFKKNLCFVDEEKGSEKLGDQPKITFLVRGKARMKGQACLVSKLLFH